MVSDRPGLIADSRTNAVLRGLKGLRTSCASASLVLRRWCAGARENATSPLPADTLSFASYGHTTVKCRRDYIAAHHQKLLLDTFDFSAIHTNRRTCHPLRGWRDHESK